LRGSASEDELGKNASLQPFTNDEQHAMQKEGNIHHTEMDATADLFCDAEEVRLRKIPLHKSLTLGFTISEMGHIVFEYLFALVRAQ
jgi:hypothetical protein